MAYIVKVTIENTHPPVWRRLLLPSGMSFADLHRVLQTAFGWEDAHLHEFSLPNREAQIIPRGEEAYSDWVYEDQAVIDDFLPACKWIRYTYDFGDDWQHKIVLEKTDETCTERTARVLKAKGDGFAEDSGGVWDSRERIPFDLNEINAQLEKFSIRESRSSKRAEELAAMIGFHQEVRSLSGNAGKKEEFEEMLRRMSELVMEDGMSEMSGMEEQFFDDSLRGQMIESWQDVVEETLGQGKTLSVNMEALQGTMEEAYAQCSENTRYLFERYLKPEDCSSVGIARFFRENPRYLLYVLTEQDYTYLKKLYEIPEHRSFSVNRLEEAEAVIRGLTLGLLNVQVRDGRGQKIIGLSFTKEAATVFVEFSQIERKRIWKELEKASDVLTALLRSYGLLDAETLRKEFVRIYGSGLSETELDRIIYWHLCFMGYADFCPDGQGGDLIHLPYIDAADVMEARQQYGTDENPYKRFSAKELTADLEELCTQSKCWRELKEFISEDFSCEKEEAKLWLEELYEHVQDGSGAEDLWLAFEESFELDYQMSRNKAWMIFMDLCMHTPLPMLKGYTRAEYAELTGKAPWELGLIRWEEAPFWDTEDEEGYALFTFSTELQYRIYTALGDEENRDSLIELVDQAVSESGEDSDDLLFLKGLALIMDGRIKEAEKLLRKVSRGDESVAMLLAGLKGMPDMGDLRSGTGRKNAGSLYMDTDSDMAPEEGTIIVPFRRGSAKIGRNDPCPCGSGKKFKKCCMGKGIYD